ncbi:MAG: carboxylesterase family protein [Fluviicola sp.]
MNKKLLFLLIIFSICLNGMTQIVSTEFGQVQGSTNGTIKQFLGIPFAKPPVDSLRWKAPQNPDNWAGTLITTSYAPVCPQKKFDQGGTNDSLIGNEDCLYLNVWTPQTTSANLPVLVFIHGGGNQQGSTNEINGGTEMYFGKNMAERGNAVIVTIQYRLGPLGFLVHPGLEPETPNGTAGNYAAMDQILALHWVQNNISNFGGDPSKVMIFGESAGGVNVGNLLTTPLASGLFQRALIQSATPLIGDYTTGKNKGIQFVDSFTVVGTDVQKIAYMRTLPTDSLVKDLTPPISGGAVGMNWQSVIDNQVFFDFPLTRIESGNFNKVPLIIGSNSEEMSLSAPPTVTPGMMNLLIATSIPAPFQAQATTLYPPGSTNSQARESYINLFTDAQFTSTTRRVAQCVSVNQTEPVYRYFFTHKHSIAPLAALGSYHGMELFYVFNTWEDATLGSGPLFSPQDDSVQNNLLNYWVNFANTGNPNGGSLVNWPVYSSTSDNYIELKATPDNSQSGLRTAESDFWDAISGFTACTSSIGLIDISTSNQFSFYPNPTSGKIHFDSDLSLNASNCKMYNQLGVELPFTISENQLDISNQVNGIYFLQIQTKEGIVSYKIIKQ